MGIKDLFKLRIEGTNEKNEKVLKSLGISVSLDQFQNKTVFIDASGVIIAAINATIGKMTNEGGLDSGFVKVIDNKIKEFNKHKIKHIWVFDYEKPERIDYNKTEGYNKYYDEIKIIKSLIIALGIPYIETPKQHLQAEQLACRYVEQGYGDYIYSADSDIFMYPVNFIHYNNTKGNNRNKNPKYLLFKREDVENVFKRNNMTENDWIQMCLLLGWDCKKTYKGSNGHTERYPKYGQTKALKDFITVRKSGWNDNYQEAFENVSDKLTEYISKDNIIHKKPDKQEIEKIYQTYQINGRRALDILNKINKDNINPETPRLIRSTIRPLDNENNMALYTFDVSTVLQFNGVILSLDTETTTEELDIDKKVCLVQFKFRQNDMTYKTLIVTKEMLDNKEICNKILNNLLNKAEIIVAHNTSFDVRNLEKVFGYKRLPKQILVDTLVLASLLLAADPYTYNTKITNKVMNKASAFTKNDDKIIKFSYSDLVLNYFGISLEKSYQECDWNTKLTENHYIYAALDVEFLEPIMLLQLKRLKELGMEKITDLENETINATISIEKYGMPLTSNLQAYTDEIKSKHNIMENCLSCLYQSPKTKEILEEMNIPYTLAGIEAIIASPTVLVEYISKLLDDEEVKIKKTNKKELKNYMLKHPEYIKELDSIITYRSYQHYLSNDMKVLYSSYNNGQKRLFPTYNQIGTTTGRASTSDPAVNGFSSRDANKSPRDCIRAGKGRKILVSDYGQIEFRIMAEQTNDELMIENFNKGIDMYRATAAALRKIDASEVSDKIRNDYKAICLGFQYGRKAKAYYMDIITERNKDGAFVNINYTLEQAEKDREMFMDTYKGISDFIKMRDLQCKGKKNIRVATIWNRQRLIIDTGSGINNKSYNSATQGTSADITKLALYYILQIINNNSLDCQLIMTAHDEIVLECEESIAELCTVIQTKSMKVAASQILHKVKVEVETHIGDTWGDGKKKTTIYKVNQEDEDLIDIPQLELNTIFTPYILDMISKLDYIQSQISDKKEKQIYPILPKISSVKINKPKVKKETDLYQLRVNILPNIAKRTKTSKPKKDKTNETIGLKKEETIRNIKPKTTKIERGGFENNIYIKNLKTSTVIEDVVKNHRQNTFDFSKNKVINGSIYLDEILNKKTGLLCDVHPYVNSLDKVEIDPKDEEVLVVSYVYGLRVIETDAKLKGKEYKDSSRCYLVFKNPTEYLDFIGKNIIDKPEHLTFVEEIHKNRYQKFRMDIDIEIGDNSEQYQSLSRETVEKELFRFIDNHIKPTIKNLFSVEILTEKDILITESCLENKKYSYHLILNNYKLLDTEQCRLLYNAIMKSVGGPKSKVFRSNIIAYNSDRTIYDDGHSFRLLYNFKLSDNKRPKLPFYDPRVYPICKKDKTNETIGLIKYEDYCITYTKEIKNLLPPLSDFLDIETAERTINIDLPKKYKIVYDNIIQTHFGEKWIIQWNKQKGSIVPIKPDARYMCKICNVIHEGAVPPFLILQKNGIFYVCRNASRHGVQKPHDRLDLDTYYPENEISFYADNITVNKENKVEDTDYGDLSLYIDRDTITQKLSECKEWTTLIGVNDYPDGLPIIYESDIIIDYQPIIQKYDRSSILIWSKMETRKTVTAAKCLYIHRPIKDVIKYIDTLKDEQMKKDILHYIDITKNVKNFRQVVIVTARYSFAISVQKFMKQDFDIDFGLYKVDGFNSKPYYIIQCESLWKAISIPEILILDEVSSVLFQMTSKLHKHNRFQNQKNFVTYVTHAKHVIMMDGDVDIRAIECLKEFRSNIPLHIQINTRQVKDIKCISLKSQAQLAFKARQKIIEGKNIMFVTTSKEEGKVLCDMFKSWGLVENQERDDSKGISGGFIFVNVEKGDDEIKLINEDVNKYWVKFKIVIFTSVITTGIDFNVPHFHYVFVYGVSVSTHVRDILQMIGRCRIIIDKEIYCCLVDINMKSYPVTFGTIIEKINSNLKQHTMAIYAGLIKNKDIKHGYEGYVVDDIIDNLLSAKLNDNYWTRLLIRNKMEIYLSKRHFTYIFNTLFKSKGFKMLSVDKDVPKGQKAIYSTIKKAVKEKNTQKTIKSFDKYSKNPIDRKEFKDLQNRKINMDLTAKEKKRLKYAEFRQYFTEECKISGEDYTRIESKKLLKTMLDFSLIINKSIDNILLDDLEKFTDSVGVSNALCYYSPKYGKLNIYCKVMSDLKFKTYTDLKHIVSDDDLYVLYREYINDLNFLSDILSIFKITEHKEIENIYTNKGGAFTKLINRIIKKVSGCSLKVKRKSNGHSYYSLEEPIKNYLNLVSKLKKHRQNRL